MSDYKATIKDIDNIVKQIHELHISLNNIHEEKFYENLKNRKYYFGGVNPFYLSISINEVTRILENLKDILNEIR